MYLKPNLMYECHFITQQNIKPGGFYFNEIHSAKTRV